MPNAHACDIVYALRPMTEEERQRGLAALAELDALREQMLARRDGQPFPSSVEIIREMREERSQQLDCL